MIDMQMMRRRGVWTTNAVAFCVGFSMFAAFGFLPQFLQTPEAAGYGFGASISESGRLLLPSAVASFLVGFWTATLIRDFGARKVIVSGAVTMAGAFLAIALWHDSTWQLYAATTVQGVGSGLVFSSLAGVVIASVPAHQTGVASGMNANIRTIGGSVGAAVMAGRGDRSSRVARLPGRERLHLRLRAPRRGHGRRDRGRLLHPRHPPAAHALPAGGREQRGPRLRAGR